MSISAVSCLICCQLHTPARVQRIKLENENIFEGDATDGCDSVENQRNVIFLLRKLLEIPTDVCSYLRQSYGDPCLGVSCCDSCSVLVDKGRMIIQELSLLQKQLENVKNELKIAIVNSQQPNSNCENEMKGATVIVRSYIKSANRENIFIQNCDNILAVKLTDCCRIPSKSPSVIGENYFDVEADDNIDVKIHASPYSCHEDDVENDPNEEDIYPHCSEPLARSISTRPFRYSEDRPFKCDICGQRYKSSESLKNHKLNHTARLACTICGKRFKRHYALRCHQRTHTGEKPYECNICGNRYSMSNSLNRHKLTHTEGKPHKCETCGKGFVMLRNLQDHQRIHNVETESCFACDICAETFSSSDILRKHKKDHSTTCKICGKASTSLSDLKNHQKIHMGKKPYECKLCGYHSSFSSCLSRHMRTHKRENRNAKNVLNYDILNTHKSIDKEAFACNVCGERFTLPSVLKDHQKSHAAEKPKECNSCGNRYSQAFNLNRHMLTHTKEKPHKCQTCGKGLATLRNLKNHQRTHTGEKPFVCEFCRKRYSSLEILKRHKIIHTKPLTCKACGKLFTALSILIIHQRTHTGEQPYERTICGYRFSQASGLTRHMRTHTGEKRYKCETCGKCFTALSNLQYHQRIHTGERPFVCRICGKGFVRPSQLKSHLKTHKVETSNAGSSFGKVVSDSVSLEKPLVLHSEEGKEGREKSFKCDLCGEAFKAFGLLVRHAFSHRSNRSFSSDMTFGDPVHHHTQNKSVEISEEEKEVYILP